MRTDTNTAPLLSLIAPLFSYLSDEEYGQLLQNGAWQVVVEAAEAFKPGSAEDGRLGADGRRGGRAKDDKPVAGERREGAASPAGREGEASCAGTAGPADRDGAYSTASSEAASRPFRREGALELPDLEVRSALQNEVLVSGTTFAAMPVESLYKPWSSQTGNAFGAARGLYMGDPARHLSAVYDELSIDVPEAFSSMPDHLSLELELLSLLVEAGNRQAVSDLVADHFDWLGDYDAALAERAATVEAAAILSVERRENLLRGIGFLRTLLAVAQGLAHEAARAAAAPAPARAAAAPAPVRAAAAPAPARAAADQ